MKLISILILLATLLHSSNAQSDDLPSTLTVLGKFSYVEHAIGYGIQIVFEENANKCDPVKGVVPLEEQIKNFRETAVARMLDVAQMEIVRRAGYVSYPGKRVDFKIVQPTAALASQLITICHELGIHVDKVFYILPQLQLIAEDNKAVAALNDASRKAESLANILGKKVASILSIDEDLYVLQESYYFSSEYVKFANETNNNYFPIDCVFSSIEYEYPQPIYEGTYSVLVTYQIE